MPTPSGVPVAMMSLGCSVMPADSVSIRVGISKIRSRVWGCYQPASIGFHALVRHCERPHIM